jgi:hypothetical protein
MFARFLQMLKTFFIILDCTHDEKNLLFFQIFMEILDDD